MQANGGDPQFVEYLQDDARHFGVKVHGDSIVVDHIDVALIKLAKPPFLRSFPAPGTLDLIAFEGKNE